MGNGDGGAMRRGVGISGLQKQAQAKETFKEAGQAMASAQIEQLQQQFAKFKAGLEEFARKHQKDINKNPTLRSHFQKMCASIGVDPLVSGKGFWAQVLGVGDFYYELGVQIVEACLLLRDETGGLVDLAILKARILRARGSNAVEISDDDIVGALATLKPLGSGFAIVKIGSRKVVQSVPRELSNDHESLLALGDRVGFVAASTATARLGWQLERFERATETMIGEGLVWIDNQSDEPRYWFPCFFDGLCTAL